MNTEIEDLLERINLLEKELEIEFGLKHADLERHEITSRRASFFKKINWTLLITLPIICSLIMPLAVLDLWGSFYQFVCFPIYGIKKVRRSDYIIIDHHYLNYLSFSERFSCVYSSYANGLIAYLREMAARTEQYFCPIKHAKPILAPQSGYQQIKIPNT